MQLDLEEIRYVYVVTLRKRQHNDQPSKVQPDLEYLECTVA
jgi:hypothetical protein